jgi:rhamnogalacturonyl hydrolase YesR
MKNLKITIMALLLLVVAAGCKPSRQQQVTEALQNGIAIAAEGFKANAAACEGMNRFPRTYQADTLVTVDAYDWTSGFFAGDLWLTYELTGDKELEAAARKYTAQLYEIKDFTGHHDLGFMIYCSYGRQWANFQEPDVLQVIIDAANSLCTRFNPQIGQIRSWDFGEWNYPVIVDNLMNLEMLFFASKMTGDKKYYDVAVKHADTTLENHFRPDGSSYHVVSYNNDGTIESKGTFQGFAHESSWARGQAWTVYGYTMCYRETGDEKYLTHAEHIANYIMNAVQTEDKIPYWDYHDTAIPDVPRDASAAAVTASALLELSTLTKDADKAKAYVEYAEDILLSLSSPEYMAEEGNGNFLLKHSVSHKPLNSEIDVPLVYADYYYLEAAQRYLALKNVK